MPRKKPIGGNLRRARTAVGRRPRPVAPSRLPPLYPWGVGSGLQSPKAGLESCKNLASGVGPNAQLSGPNCQDKATRFYDPRPIEQTHPGCVCVVMSRYASAGDALASVLYRNYHARCRYRAEELRPGCYAVVERGTSVIVLSGFPSCEAAWSWIANRLGARYEDWARRSRQI